jgi:hypothetical protein
MPKRLQGWTGLALSAPHPASSSDRGVVMRKTLPRRSFCDFATGSGCPSDLRVQVRAAAQLTAQSPSVPALLVERFGGRWPSRNRLTHALRRASVSVVGPRVSKALGTEVRGGPGPCLDRCATFVTGPLRRLRGRPTMSGLLYSPARPGGMGPGEWHAPCFRGRYSGKSTNSNLGVFSRRAGAPTGAHQVLPSGHVGGCHGVQARW